MEAKVQELVPPGDSERNQTQKVKVAWAARLIWFYKCTASA